MSTIDKIILLLDESGKSQKEFADFLGITKNAITDWKSGRIKSYRKYIPKIAEFFDVSTDYLLSDDVNTSTQESETPSISELMEGFLKLSQEDKVEFIKLATMINNPKHKV